MKIEICIYPDAKDLSDMIEENLSYSATADSFDDAIAEIGKLERIVKKDKEAEEKMQEPEAL